MARCRAMARAGALALTAVLQSAPQALANLPGCEVTPSAAASVPHSLACRAFATDGAEMAWNVLIDRLANVPIALLGEVHDNAQHHRIRAQIILALEAERGQKPRPAIVLEHIRQDQDLALTAFRALDRRQPRHAVELLKALAWERSGWPDQSLFMPLFQAALDAEWPILAGNPANGEVRAVARQGLSALAGEEVARLGLAAPLPASAQADLLDELEASHCGLMPKAAFGGMADAQRYRDAHMAHAVADARRVHGRVFLLAGNGHVRLDRGVPWHLRRLAPDHAIATVLFLELDDTKPTALDYADRGSVSKPTADIMVLTPSAARPDPCAEMRKNFGK